MKSFLKFLLASILGVMISGLIIFLILMGVIGAMVSSQDKTFEVKPQSILMLKLDQPVVDRKSTLPIPAFGSGILGIENQIGLNDLLANLNKAAKDTNICGIYLEMSSLQAGIATVEEIRNGLLEFKKSGKFIISYSDFYTQKAYYLASVSDKVCLNPMGVFNFDGLSTEILFFKKALEKLDVEPQIIRHGKFKSAVEPLMYDKMSPENRQQIQTYMGSIWQNIIHQIADERSIPAEKINALADMMSIGSAQDALQAGMIDSIMYKDQILDLLVNMSKVKNTKKLNLVSHNQYVRVPKHRDHKGLAKNKIAVIYASGDIVDGEGKDDNIGSESLSRTIREAREDSAIKAIVFRVNSGGGSALASEVIWRELDLARRVKPVIASMGDVAASGGYYVLAAADTVLASPNTITGSIGVFGVLLNAKDFLNNKLGISADVVKTNRHSDFGTINRPLDDEERQLMQYRVDQTYDTFISHVAEGRNKEKAAIDNIGEGRVWSGVNAKEIGLVDDFGGLATAIEMAAKKAKVEQYRVVELPKLKEPFEQIMKELTGETSVKRMQQELGTAYRYYRQLKGLINANGLMARMPFEIVVE
jgi:protease IV